MYVKIINIDNSTYFSCEISSALFLPLKEITDAYSITTYVNYLNKSLCIYLTWRFIPREYQDMSPIVFINSLDTYSHLEFALAVPAIMQLQSTGVVSNLSTAVHREGCLKVVKLSQFRAYNIFVQQNGPYKHTCQ